MTVNPLTPPILSGQNIESLARDFEAGAIEARREVGQQFESLFVSLLLKEMRQSLSGEGLFPGDSSDSYGAIFDQYLGEHLAQGGAFGIAKLVNQQLTTGAS